MGVFDQPEAFKCTICGECCKRTSAEGDYGVVMNFADVERLAPYLGLGIDEFIAIHTERTEFTVKGRLYEAFLLKFGEDKCRFLQPDNKCGVHEVKPTQCRYTPYRFFWDGTYDLWCMEGVTVPPDWTSQVVDDAFLDGLRFVPVDGQEVNHA
jgi:Fe-S-cluster containining protein